MDIEKNNSKIDVETSLEALPNIYLERSGKGSRELSELLLAPPEDPISPEDVEKVQTYEAELCSEVVLEDEEGSFTLEGMLKEHKGESINAPSFFAEAFLQDQVHVEGLEGQLRQFRTAEDVYTWLAIAAKDRTITSDQFREMARQSAAYYKTEATKALLAGTRPDPDVLNYTPIVIEPDKALRFARAGFGSRGSLLAKRHAFKGNPKGLDGAKRAITDIYLKRVNGQVAADIPVLESLIEQSRLIYDHETEVDAYTAMPSLLRDAATDRRTRPLLNKRLDFIKYGIGYDEHGVASSVDATVFEAETTSAEQDTSPPLFNKEKIEILKNFIISPELMKEIFTLALKEAGLLSSEDPSSWKPGRGHRATDGLYQVVTSPTKDTFAVDGIDGVFMSPNKERPLWEVLTVGPHELTHVDQTQADLLFGMMFKIGVLKGRRVSMLRETGANMVQRKFERKLSGESKPVAFGYARAIQSLEAGGDMFDAAKAFFESKLETNMNEGVAKLAAEAADRVLRLMLSGGKNSQPMTYAEENIMHVELKDASPEVRKRATLITNLDLDDQARLHKYGLLPTIEGKLTDWPEILLRILQPVIEEAFQEYYDKDVEENKSVVLSYN